VRIQLAGFCLHAPSIFEIRFTRGSSKLPVGEMRLTQARWLM
jgi:hypothetical protein